MSFTRAERDYYYNLAVEYLEVNKFEVSKHVEYEEYTNALGVTENMIALEQPITWDLTTIDGNVKTCTFIVAMKGTKNRKNSYRMTSHTSIVTPDFFLIYIPELAAFTSVPGDYFQSEIQRDLNGRPVIRGGKPQYIKQVGYTKNIPYTDIERIRNTPNRKLWR